MTSFFQKSNRRDFLRISATVGAATFAAPGILSAKSPNEKLNVAVIGPCGRGGAQLDETGKHENVFAICDINDDNLAKVGEKYPKAKKYVDFRKLLEEEKTIDAVMVSTPDHTHAPASAMAMRLGKHCYCEKPLAHSIYEIRKLTEIAKEKKVVTQMGTQIHAGDNYRRVVEIIQAGAIGPVTEVLVWCEKSWGGGRRPQETPAVPKNIHWDEWLGPATLRPYHPCYLPGQWRRHWDFGTGTAGDMGSHIMDIVFWALKLQYPTSVWAKSPEPVHPEGCPKCLMNELTFPARGELPAVKMTWADSSLIKNLAFPKILDMTPRKPAKPGEKAVHVPNQFATGGIGALFIGRDGMLWTTYGAYKLYPEEKFKDFKAPPQTIPKSIGHHKEFFEACKTGGPTTCDFSYSGPLSESVQLGTVAYRVGKGFEWDAANLKAVGCPEADQLINPPYRKGWTL